MHGRIGTFSLFRSQTWGSRPGIERRAARGSSVGWLDGCRAAGWPSERQAAGQLVETAGHPVERTPPPSHHNLQASLLARCFRCVAGVGTPPPMGSFHRCRSALGRAPSLRKRLKKSGVGPCHRVQISWFHAKLNDLSQSSAVSASALLKQFEKQIVRRFISLKTRSTAFRFPCFSYLKS